MVIRYGSKCCSSEKTGRLSSITLDSGGIGYSTAPTVEVTGGGGKDGVVNIDIQSIAGNITSSGSGYLAGSYPNVQFTGGSPTTIATGTFVIPGFSGTITNGGSGYTDGTYQTNFRNVPTATYTVTVVQRDKLNLSNITGGTFAVGNTVTGSVSGATGTVTKVLTDAVFVNNVTGSFLDAQQENIATGGVSAQLDSLNLATNRYLIDLGSGPVEAPSITLVDNNTYRFDQVILVMPLTN